MKYANVQHTQPLYIALATLLAQRNSLAAFGAVANPEQRKQYEHVCSLLYTLSNEYLPSGSGFNDGTRFEMDPPNIYRIGSPIAKLVFSTSFHHMEEGYYACVTEHKVVIKPDWSGFLMSVTGRNYGGIKEYIEDTFFHALNAEVTYNQFPQGEAA